MRDLIVGLFIVASLPSCFRRPFIGLLMFSLLAYMRLQDLTWGWARDQRWSYYVALVTLLGFVFSHQPDKRFFRPDLRCWVMIALALLVGLSLLFSANLRPHGLRLLHRVLQDHRRGAVHDRDRQEPRAPAHPGLGDRAVLRLLRREERR